MNGKCGVCDRPKGRGYGECSAPDSTDYTVSILCLSVALQNARAEVATAEERGRRRGVEEHNALKAAHEYCLYMFEREWLTDERNRSVFAARIFAILDRALAPRAPHASEGPPCAGCGHPKWQHQYGSKERAFCCAPLDELQRDYCRCKNYLAPRDSGKEKT